METMEITKTNTKTNFVMTTDNFENEIEKFITKLQRHVEFMDYQITGDINFKELENLKNSLIQLSLSQKKKLRNLLIKAIHRMSLRSINQFLHFLYKAVLKTDKRVRIKPSVTDEEIQIKRKEWVIARNKSELALFLYKKTKGDFYIEKMKKIEIAKKF